MAVLGLYDFNDTDTTARDSALDNGAQNGVYLNGATASNGDLLLDGIDDYVRIDPSDDFQLSRGQIDIKFSQAAHVGTGPNTVLSRDVAGDVPGGFRIEVLADGSVRALHETGSGTETFSTAAGFFATGDLVRVRYSWDQNGAGGYYTVVNMTTGTDYIARVPDTLSMDQGDLNAPWIIGAGSGNQQPGDTGGIDQHFQGMVRYFQVSDELNPGSGSDGIVWGTDGGDLIDTAYTGDNDGDMIDAGDAILPGFDPDGDYVRAGAGDDTVLAGEGHDLVFGGDGNDLIHGGEGGDRLSGDRGDDTIHGDGGNDHIEGDSGDDVLYGGDGHDRIYGGVGNDTIYGGAGLDRLYGGDDRDTFFAGAGDVVRGGSGGDDYDTLDLRGQGTFRIVDRTTDSDGNGWDGRVEFLDGDGRVTGELTFSNIENIVPCFTPGTLIATPKGERPVEDLRPGDKIITRDNGIQEIRWTGRKDMDWKALAANPHLKPVLIRQGSLGHGLPERDMLVSPNHRILVANDRTSLYFDEHEVLVAAKHLVGEGVNNIESMGTSYIHFMCDRHEVVLSNGAWTETFQPGDYTLKGMGNAQRNEIFELFPELKTEQGKNDYVAARKTLKRHEARLLVK
ncbi:Hint domain-containing protein [Ruixingdingia sedimenti]|uniref:Hint domain-containing protein n=1 Tax=Ruixingdingia sedimenti TaxID=3073604 RepID=A0ABU1F7W5_9RHOB|nr:Hint domain-containing protein [Xinfangfangia sp. LG-4]MDR5652962.1 Hint domain-containing protein [Xinfangfangia sp. LG-4]